MLSSPIGILFAACAFCIISTMRWRYHAFGDIARGSNSKEYALFNAVVASLEKSAQGWFGSLERIGSNCGQTLAASLQKENGTLPSICIAFVADADRKSPFTGIPNIVVSMYSTLSGIHCAPHGPVHVHVHLRKTVGASAFAQRLNRAGFSTKVSTSVENDAVMQETSDYMKAIDECRHFGADATVVIQDDVWATPSFYSDLITSVRAAGAKGKDAWMLKAFTTMRWEGWSLHEPRHWVELILVGLIGCASYAAMLRRGEYLHSSGTKRLFAQIASAAIFVVSVAIIGRQNFLFDIRARPGIVSNEMGASAVCIAFSARAVELAQRLSNASHTTLYDDRDPIDVILSKWRQAAGIPQYITNPSLVEHAGMYSSLPWKGRWQRLDSLHGRLESYTTAGRPPRGGISWPLPGDLRAKLEYGNREIENIRELLSSGFLRGTSLLPCSQCTDYSLKYIEPET